MHAAMGKGLFVCATAAAVGAMAQATTPSVSLTEIWETLNTFLLVIVGFLLRDAWVDLKAMRAQVNKLDKKVAVHAAMLKVPAIQEGDDDAD